MLKKLKDMFSGGNGHSDDGIYLYIKLDRSEEIVELRLAPQQELVPDYDNGGYFSRKTIVGPQSYKRAEATFYFDDQRNFTTADIDGGELSTREAYQAQFDDVENGSG